MQRFVSRVMRPVRGWGYVVVNDDDDALSITVDLKRQDNRDDDIRIPIKLTSAGTSAGFYHWTEQEWVASGGTWQDRATGARTETDLGEARELNGLADLITGNSSRVYYLRPSTQARRVDGSLIWEFSATPSSGFFPVKVQQTGGINGTDSTAATYTYTVRTLDWDGSSGGVVLGTNVPLARPRMPGAVTVQAGSTHYGEAFYDGSTLRLWDAGEIHNTVDGCE